MFRVQNTWYRTKTEKHTSRFVWGYFNPRMRTEIYFEQTGICLFWRHLGKSESHWAMVFLQLLFDARWSYLRISETRRRMKIFSYRGRAGKGCLRISQGEFRPNVVLVEDKTFSFIRSLRLQGNRKATTELLKDEIIFQVSHFSSCCSIIFLFLDDLVMEACRWFPRHHPPQSL